MNIYLSFFGRYMRTLTWLSRSSIYIYPFLRSAKAQRCTGDAATTAHAYMTSYAHCAKHTSSLACWFCYLKSNQTPSFPCCANYICNKMLHVHGLRAPTWRKMYKTTGRIHIFFNSTKWGWGLALSSKEDFQRLLDKSVHWGQGRLAAGRAPQSHPCRQACTSASAQHSSAFAPGTGHAALGFFSYALV